MRSRSIFSEIVPGVPAIVRGPRPCFTKFVPANEARQGRHRRRHARGRRAAFEEARLDRRLDMLRLRLQNRTKFNNYV